MNNSVLNIFPSGGTSEVKRVQDINFSSSSACGDVLFILNANISNPVLCEDCLRAITVLSSQHVNQVKFINLDAIPLIIKSIFVNIKVISVVEWGVRSLSILSANELAVDKIVKAEGCKILTLVLRCYNDNDVIVEILYDVIPEYPFPTYSIVPVGPVSPEDIILYIKYRYVI